MPPLRDGERHAAAHVVPEQEVGPIGQLQERGHGGLGDRGHRLPHGLAHATAAAP